jgi:hypothetical protein
MALLTKRTTNIVTKSKNKTVKKTTNITVYDNFE